LIRTSWEYSLNSKAFKFDKLFKTSSIISVLGQQIKKEGNDLAGYLFFNLMDGLMVILN
jgi:hypothetical protein